MVLKIVFCMKTEIVIIQKLFINCQELCHSRFKFYCPKKETQDIKIITIVMKNLIYKILVEYKIDLIDHPYFMLLEICELDLRFKKRKRKT